MTTLRFDRIPETPVPGKPLGRTILHDTESLRYTVTPRSAAAYTSVRHERFCPTLDQNRWYDPVEKRWRALGSCVPNSGLEAVATGAVWAAIVNAADVAKPALTEDQAVDWYTKVTRLDPFAGEFRPDDTGSNGLTMAKLLKSLDLIGGYLHATSLEGGLTALHGDEDTPGVGFLTGITWKTGCDEPDAEGIIHWTGQVRGGHELYVREYDAERGLVWLDNHWSEDWGIRGRAAMPAEEFAAAVRDDGDITVLLPRTAPAPVPGKPVPVGADAALVAGMEPWRKGILSKLTRAGQAASAYDSWLVARGYR